MAAQPIPGAWWMGFAEALFSDADDYHELHSMDQQGSRTNLHYRGGCL